MATRVGEWLGRQRWLFLELFPNLIGEKSPPTGKRWFERSNGIMKMVRAVIRPEKTEEVAAALDKAGYPSMTKFHVFGRGKQGGLRVGSVHYDELSKVLLMLVVEDDETGEVVEVISDWAKTGNMGDGKIFVTSVEEVHTIRTGEVQR